jgi:hypothetical protein
VEKLRRVQGLPALRATPSGISAQLDIVHAARNKLIDNLLSKPIQPIESGFNVNFHISDKPLTDDEWQRKYAA